MASDNQANYARIGFFIIAGIALILGTLVWLGGFGGNKNVFYAETYFPNDVSGLDVGSAVNFRGVHVGAVKEISFVGAKYRSSVLEDARKILVLLSFDRRLFHIRRGEDPEESLKSLVGKGLHATVSASGVTGLSHIELNFPKGTRPKEARSWESECITIPPAPSILQSAADSATQILDQINRMDLLAAWTNAVSTIEGANVAIGALGTLIESNGGSIGEILDNVREASASLRDLVDEVKSNPSLLLRSREPEHLPETQP